MGPGRGQAGAPGARPDPAALRAPSRLAPPTRRRRHGGLPGRLLPAQLRESHPSARRAPPAHFCPVFFLPTVSSFAFLQTCPSGCAARLLAPGPPCHSVSLPPLPPQPWPRATETAAVRASGYGGGGVGRAGAGEGSALRGLLPGAGETEARGPGRGGCCGRPAPDLETSSWRASRGLSPGRSDSLCALPGPCPLRPGSSVPLQSLPQSVCPCPSASVCSSVFICYLSRSVRFSDSLCPSVASPSVIVYSLGSVRLSACPMCPCLRTFSLAQANSWHFSK